MKFKRLICTLNILDGLLVRSQSFKYHQAIGDPLPTIRRLTDWNVDEVVLLNISRNRSGVNTKLLDSRRSDKWHNLNKQSFVDLLTSVSPHISFPLSVGGGLRCLHDIDQMFRAGADKCVVNTLCFENPTIISDAASKFGSQAIIASLDVKYLDGRYVCFTTNGTVNTQISLEEALILVQSLGVGEIFLSSIDFDGAGNGYDLKLIDILDNIEIPLILNSGAKLPDHFSKALEHRSVDAASAANIFYFTELSYPLIKKEIINRGINLRRPTFSSRFFNREPIYSIHKRDQLLLKSQSSQFFDPSIYDGSLKLEKSFCKRCLYSSLSATPTQFDSNGVCMGCRVSDVKLSTSSDEYKRRENRLRDIIKSRNSFKRDYDCIVTVSGGKDSYYQVHYVKQILGLNPLLVTYNGNNYSQEGWENLMNMRSAFDVDHIVVSPSILTLKKLNKLAFIAMGDMNWHAHIGIMTTAPRVAVQLGIPFIFWGEHGYADLSGQFSMDDFPEKNYRERLEHSGRGFDWNFFLGLDGLDENNLRPWQYPSDSKLYNLGLRQIYLGHYIPWESNDHLKLVIDKYKFKVSSKPFVRTYRRGSNLDDIHENGIHDYLKYIKFGYGRCTDHVCKDIRAGILSRHQGLELVQKMDHAIPPDLDRWCKYVSMSVEDFFRIADHFRDPRVWQYNIFSNTWSKDPIR